MSCPSATGLRSTSIGAPAAMVDASGFIWEMKGQSAAAPPTAAAAPVATNKKSRRVGWSAEDAVVTIPTLSSYAAGGTAPGAPKVPRTACRRPRPPAAAELRVPPPKQGENSSPESFYWHPCRASASPLSARERAMREFRGQRCLLRHFRLAPNPAQPMQIALFQPDIPQNTGTILRLCACLGVAAHIIEPAGFPVSDRHFRRAGMDYLDQVSIVRHDSWSKFEQWRAAQGARLLLFTTKGATDYRDFRYQTADILLFGRESAGVTEAVVEAADARLVIPIAPGLRSLNVAMTAAMAAGEALRQLRNPQV